jgi:hypothetical protein
MDTKFFKSPVGALGWTWGIICLFVVGLFSAYANWLLAAFHFIDAMVRGSLDTEILWAFFWVSFSTYQQKNAMGQTNRSRLLICLFLFLGREMYYITLGVSIFDPPS